MHKVSVTWCICDLGRCFVSRRLRTSLWAQRNFCQEFVKREQKHCFIGATVFTWTACKKRLAPIRSNTFKLIKWLECFIVAVFATPPVSCAVLKMPSHVIKGLRNRRYKPFLSKSCSRLQSKIWEKVLKLPDFWGKMWIEWTMKSIWLDFAVIKPQSHSFFSWSSFTFF